jgi:hypothetical protein
MAYGYGRKAATGFEMFPRIPTPHPCREAGGVKIKRGDLHMRKCVERFEAWGTYHMYYTGYISTCVGTYYLEKIRLAWEPIPVPTGDEFRRRYRDAGRAGDGQM